MELVVKGRNIEVLEAVREHVERKIGKLDHYLERITEAEVEVAEEKTKSHGNRFVIQVTVHVNGTTLRAQEKDADVRTAVDAVARVMIQQINRYKGKLRDRSKAGPTIRLGESLATEEAERPSSDGFVKVKRFLMKPMDPDEAAEQMELLGHSFFLFFNAATGRYGVVYRRGDGQYGLIEPELP